MAVSASQVSSLRARTGAGILDCKKALDASAGDEEKAIAWLREKGIAKAAKKANRETSEGRIFFAEGAGKIAAVSLTCETDFVAGNDDFRGIGAELAAAALEKGSLGEEEQAKVTEMIARLGENSAATAEILEVPAGGAAGFYLHSNGKLATIIILSGSTDSALAKEIAMHATATAPLVVAPEDLSEEGIAAERPTWEKEVEGKPEEIRGKILAGKEAKFRAEKALLEQPFVKDPEKKIRELLPAGAGVVEMKRLELS